MTETIVISPAERAPLRYRRGIVLGIATLFLSLLTAFWSVIVWAISFGLVERGALYVLLLVLFVLCSFIGLVSFAFTAVFGVLALMRNAPVGVICGLIGLVIGVGALTTGILVAFSVS